MASEMDLLVNYMCPFAQRGLYAYSYKGIDCTVTEVSLKEKSDYFLSVNPLGKVPSLRVVKEGKTYNLGESLIVAEYFDSFPGPAMFPRNPDGSVNEEEKALIKIIVATKIESIMGGFFKLFMEACNSENIVDLQSKLVEYSNTFLVGGGYFMHTILGRNEITFADIVLLPFIDRVYAYKDDSFKMVVEGVDLSNLWAWYENLGSQEWVQRVKNPPSRLNNYKNMLTGGNFIPLEIPATIYD